MSPLIWKTESRPTRVHTTKPTPSLAPFTILPLLDRVRVAVVFNFHFGKRKRERAHLINQPRIMRNLELTCRRPRAREQYNARGAQTLTPKVLCLPVHKDDTCPGERRSTRVLRGSHNARKRGTRVCGDVARKREGGLYYNKYIF